MSGSWAEVLRLPSFSLILPTRGRPALARRALDSIAQTAARPDLLEVILYVDADDEPSHAVAHRGLKIVRLIRPRASMGAITQACYAASSGRYIMLLNDDVVCQTPGWDNQVLARLDVFADDVALLWCNDRFRGATLPCHPIVPRQVCAVIGGVCPEQYHRDYIDVHLYDIFRTLKRLGHDRLVYLPEIVFEHQHVEAGKAALDSTAAKPRKTDDERTYIAWADERFLAATRLARYIAATAALAA